jgi:hypothetical protein
MKKVILGAAVLATVLVAVRRFGPRLAEKGMQKCQAMFERAGGHPQMTSVASGAEGARERCAS